MSFVLNDSQQLSLFDSLAFLSKRQLKMLENSWAHHFSKHIFSNIDELMFAPLYSSKANSRPNAPINVIVGALILKSFMGLTDDEIMDMTQGKTKGELLNWLSSLTAIRDGLENWEDWIDC